MGPRLAVIALCFFLSGATGLVYQVVWLRMLGLVFGHTVHAITTVLAAFMAGLALGSFIFARRAARIRNLVRAYGLMEIGIGLYCAAIPTLFWLASVAHLGLHRELGLSFAAFTVTQFVLIFVLLLVPTTLMGGTLPVLSQAFARDDLKLGRTISVLYGINTLGAVLGTVLAGYFVLPALGNRLTVAVAAGANLAVGMLAIALAGWRPVASPSATSDAEGDHAPPPASAIEPADPTERSEVWLTVLAVGVSGAVSMVYEVAWTRALALVIGSSTYAFTSMLVTFLIGIALGSALYGWLWGARRASPAVFGVLQLAIGLAAAAVAAAFELLPELFLLGLGRSESPAAVQLLQLGVSASALLLFTVFIGATFPCATAVAARSVRHAGRDVGHVYAVNTVGAIAGSVLAGFVLIPTVGVQSSIKLGVAVNLALAAVLFLARGRSPGWRWGAAVAALVGAVGVFGLPAWDQRVLSSGAAIYGNHLLRRPTNRTVGEALRRGGEVLFYRDGPASTVSVLRVDKQIFLKVNGKTDASNGVDMATQLLSGHIPMLIHPEARHVMVIGLGSGVTAGAVARYPAERIDVVELEPAVVEANQFFTELNGNALGDPRVRVLLGDGRNVLLTARERYDVIVSEPSNPWISGLASLFTVEFFELARARLRPGGMMVQWVQLYGLPSEDLRMIVRTFQTVFPTVTVWQGSPGDLLLVGQTVAAPLNLRELARRFDGAPATDLARIGMTGWPDVLSHFVLRSREAAEYSREAGLNTDDGLPLEFTAPRALYLDTALSNWGQVSRAGKDRMPEVSADSRGELFSAAVQYRIGLAHLRRAAAPEALQCFERALAIDERHIPSLTAGSRASLTLGRPWVAKDLAQRATAVEPRNAEALYLTGVALVSLSQRKEAVPLLERAVALDPDNGVFREALASARIPTHIN